MEDSNINNTIGRLSELRKEMEARGLDMAPRKMAKEILANPDDHTPSEIWLAVNYSNAMCLLDTIQATHELKCMLVERGVDVPPDVG